jgi:hypothetical protein
MHGSVGDHMALPRGALRRTDTFVRSKPHEAWFKMKFGEGTAMPPGMVTATQDLKNLYKALANTTDFPNL